jgi:hypothetical protein
MLMNQKAIKKVASLKETTLLKFFSKLILKENLSESKTAV